MKRVTLVLCLAACAGSDDPSPADTGDSVPTGTTDGPLAIEGTFTDAFGTVNVIDDATWTQTFAGYDPSVFAIASYDNGEEVVIAQNDAANAYDPELWSRFDWTWPDHLYYCQTAFSAATEADAEATPRADDADLDAGCGGFPWTDLTP